MESDHAPIMCVLDLKKDFRIDVGSPEPRFNFNKADWHRYGQVLDEMIDQIGFDDTPEKISPFLDEIFADLVYKSASRPSHPQTHECPSEILSSPISLV